MKFRSSGNSRLLREHAKGPNFELKKMLLCLVGVDVPPALHKRTFRYFLESKTNGDGMFVGNPLLGPTAGPRNTTALIGTASGMKRIKIRRGPNLPYLSALQDLLLTTLVILAWRRRFQVYIGFGLHFGFLGLVFRTLKIAEKNVFWTSDYFPNRFKKKTLNRLAQWLDGFCTSQSSYSWVPSKGTSSHRGLRNIVKDEYHESVITQSFFEGDIESLPTDSLIPNSLVYAGNLSPGYGFELVIDAMEIVAPRLPGAFVSVVSYTPFPSNYTQRIKSKNLSNNFRLLGFLPDSELRRILLSHKVGLAPYTPSLAAIKNSSGDSSRVKNYMSKGLPVIVTNEIEISELVRRSMAGIVIGYDSSQLANAIVTLLTNETFYETCRRNAIELASTFGASVVIRGAFSQLGISLD